MTNLYVYIATKNNLYSILITGEDGILLQKTRRQRNTEKNIGIEALQDALNYLNGTLTNEDCLVNLILPNTYLEKWIKDGYSKIDYADEFNKMYELFQSIPMQYKLLSIQNKAKAYLKEDCIAKTKVESADDLLADFEDILSNQ